MNDSLSVVIASSLKDQAYRVRSLLDRDRALSTSIKILGNGHPDPLHGVVEQPDLLILILGPAWESELDNLGTDTRIVRPPLIVLATEGNMAQMRRAMQAGAKDFLGLNVEAEELLKCIHQIGTETRKPAQLKTADAMSIIAVINSKGGSGASFIAGSLAHAFVKEHSHRVALFDLDLQFGVQDLCLDTKPRTVLTDALERARELDGIALEGCMGVSASGVRLLGEYGRTLPLPWEVNRAGLSQILRLAGSSYDQVILDLPRQIDPLTSTALEAATHVCLVMNQSLIHLRDTKRMLQILTGEVGIPRSRIRVVINRYLADAAVSLRDIEVATEVETTIQIPNDFRRASETMNLGIPLITRSPGATITKGFAEMANRFAGAPKRKAAGLRGAISGLFGGSAGDR